MPIMHTRKGPNEPLERFLWGQESEIRAAVKTYWEGNSFSLRHIADTGRTTTKLLREEGMRKSSIAVAIHPNWARINSDRLSAACVYEHFLHRFAAFGPLYSELLPLFQASPQQAQFLTLARDKDRLPLDQIDRLRPPGYYIRPVTDAVRSLSTAGCDVLAVTVMELSFGRDLDDSLFAEPHVHSLVLGAEEHHLRAEFRGSRALDKNQLQISPVTDLNGRLSYITKFKPELRVEYLTPKEQSRRRDNRVPPDLMALWLQYQVEYCMSEVLTLSCFQQGFVKRFRACRLEECVRQMLRNSAWIASQRPSAP